MSAKAQLSDLLYGGPKAFLVPFGLSERLIKQAQKIGVTPDDLVTHMVATSIGGYEKIDSDAENMHRVAEDRAEAERRMIKDSIDRGIRKLGGSESLKSARDAMAKSEEDSQ